ncbi:MAG: histidine triad nucleotide-binding protein [bacterium]
MSDCIFCQIAARKVPARIVHEDADLVAFEDLNPQAPLHVLIIPRIHRATSLDLVPADDPIVGGLFRVAASIAAARGVAADGFRLVVNTNALAGQSVYHLHVHLLGGRAFRWPPG